MKAYVKNLPKSEVEIRGEIPLDRLEHYFREALASIAAEVQLQGFRKGAAPQELVLQRVGEMHVLEEAANLALREEYPDILHEAGADAVGAPQVTITKLARGNPLGYTIVTAVMPKIALPNYTKIAKKEAGAAPAPLEVSGKEVDDVVLEIRRARAPHHHKEGETHDAAADSHEALPELTDELARSFGAFESVADLREKIRTGLQQEKEMKAKEERRKRVLDAIVAEVTTEIPEALVESEVRRMIGKLQHDLAQMGLRYEGYLEYAKKTDEELRREWRAEALRNVKMELAVEAIAKEEKLVPDKEKVEEEVSKIMGQARLPDGQVRGEAAKLDPVRVHEYVSSLFRQEKVFEFLESR